MDASAWATVGLVIFLGLMVYLSVPGMIMRNLDERADKIRDELDEARRMREEAQALLAEYQGKRKEAEKEAEEIVAAAKREAASFAEDAARKTAEFVERRTVLAEQKIEQAEADALNEVRATAVNLAVEAARGLVSDKLTAAKSSDLIKQGIAEVKAKLN